MNNCKLLGVKQVDLGSKKRIVVIDEEKRNRNTPEFKETTNGLLVGLKKLKNKL